MSTFITGKPGTGKTTLIKELTRWLNEMEVMVAGFYTGEIRQGGKRKGFGLTILPEGKEFILASLNPPGVSFGRYYVKKESIEKALHSLKKNAKFYIIDEIGPMEMKNFDFMPTVFKLIESEKNLLATIHIRLIHLIEGKGALYTLTFENRKNMFNEIKKKITSDLGIYGSSPGRK